MSRALTLVVLLVAVGASGQTQEQTDRINRWFEQNQPKWTPQAIGEIQTPGAIQLPKGIQAIKVDDADRCRKRLAVAADVLFAFDQAALSADAEETLAALGPKIRSYGEHPVTIEGHTDAKGSDEYNQSLSERRAAAVRDWLAAHQFISTAAITAGFGESRPVAPNAKPDGSDDPAGRQKNRRVEVVIDTCES